MKMKKSRKAIFIILAVVAMVATAGWISNVESKASCQRQVGAWLLNYCLGGKPFYLLGAEEDKDVRALFDSLGATYFPLNSKSGHMEEWPQLQMKTHVLVPFFISVDYYWGRAPQVGGGGSKWFFCLFGKTIETGETDGYAT